MDVAKYEAVTSKGVDHYVQTLKDHAIYSDVVERITKRNSSPIDELITRISERHVYSSQYFTDLNYSFDDFYESFRSYIGDAIGLVFNKIDYKFQIVTEYYHTISKEIVGTFIYYSEQDKNDFELEREMIEGNQSSSIDLNWHIIVFFEKSQKEYFYRAWQPDSIIGFINFLNEICHDLKIEKRWFPVASTHGSNFIFTAPTQFQLILDLGLMPPKGYQFPGYDDAVYYPEGILLTPWRANEILPIKSCSCEFKMQGTEKIIYVKLWQKSKEGELDLEIVPDLAFQKLLSLSKVSKTMKWEFGKMVMDTNHILSDEAFEGLVQTFVHLVKSAVENQSIDLMGNNIKIWRHQEKGEIYQQIIA